MITAWEQRKLGEVADRYDNLRIPITASERVPGSTPYYGANGIQDYVEGFTHQGEFVLIAEDGASDLDNYPTMCINGIIWVNNHAHVIQGRKGITDNHFIAWSIKRCDIKPMLTGGTRAKLNAEVLMGMRISTPNHAEQISIGSFFEHLDSLITLHQRKCEYRSLCGYLSWEQRKLGELFVESDERSSELEILSVSVANGIFPASQSDRETNPGASLANYKVVHPGDVVYNSMRMWQGAVDSSLYEGIVSPAYVVARPTKEVIPRFFARLLRRPELLSQYQRASQGNSKDTQVLKFDEFADINVQVPNSGGEQFVIGEAFDMLDSLITLHQ